MSTTSGDTLLLTGGGVQPPHLWVILWGPAGPADAYLAVMLTSLRSHSDRTCILDVGDHPFIRHPTSVSYREVMRVTRERLSELAANGTARPRRPVTGAVLERVRAGFFASAHTQHAYVEMAEAQFGAVRPG